MADTHLFEDEAARYVLGQLPAAERPAFEAQLAQSAELRELVRELEEGTVALALTVPRRKPPAQVWHAIESIVAEDAKRKILPAPAWSQSWKNGWAAAAACLVGWLFYALATRPNPDTAAALTAWEQAHGANAATLTASNRPGNQDTARNESNSSRRATFTNDHELGQLRWRVYDLENQLAHLSQVITQKQSLLADPSRVKFFELMPASGPGGTNQIQLSPQLQRALFLAMARELGWVPRDSFSSNGIPQNLPDASGHGTNSATGTSYNVDFVDLPPATNEAPNPKMQTQPLPSEDDPSQLMATGGSNNVPGFISGTNMVLALDQTIVPTGSTVSVWQQLPGQSSQPLGTTTMGVNPTVVSIPLSTGGGTSYFVTTTSASGTTSVLVNFAAPQ